MSLGKANALSPGNKLRLSLFGLWAAHPCYCAYSSKLGAVARARCRRSSASLRSTSARYPTLCSRKIFENFEAIVIDDGSPDTDELEQALAPVILSAAAISETRADLSFCKWVPLINGSVIGPSNLERSGIKARLDTLAPSGVLLNPFELLLEVGPYFSPSSVLVKRESLLYIGLFDERSYCTDNLDLWLRLSVRYRFAVLKDALSLRRIHARNTSNDAWMMRTNEIKTYEKLEHQAPTATPGTRLSKLLRIRMVPMLREQGAVYLERGELLSARQTGQRLFGGPALRG